MLKFLEGDAISAKIIQTIKEAYSFQYNEMNESEQEIFTDIFTRIQTNFVLH